MSGNNEVKIQIDCPIWGTPATEIPISRSPDKRVINSPRAGATFEISGTAEAMLKSLSRENKLSLTQWIIESANSGATPFISSTTIKNVRDRPLPDAILRADWMLRFLVRQTAHIGKALEFPFAFTMDQNDTPFSIQMKFENSKEINELLAWSGSQEVSEIRFLADYLCRKGFVAQGENSSLPSITVLPEGFAHLSELETKLNESENSFVAMWFDPSMDEVFEFGFEAAIRDSGYEPIRIDRKEHINKIDDEIISEIRRAKFVIADFTSEIFDHKKQQIHIPRGGVYFEAGYALGLGIPVIWTCRKDVISLVHFDTRQFNHITWTDSKDLYERLLIRIGAVIGDGPLK